MARAERFRIDIALFRIRLWKTNRGAPLAWRECRENAPSASHGEEAETGAEA